MALLLRKLATRFFGTGPAGVVATAIATWGFKKIREGMTNPAEVIDVSTLKPGETYTIETRPAPTRKERKLDKAVSKAQRRATSKVRRRKTKAKAEAKAALLEAELLQRRARAIAQARAKDHPRRRRIIR